MKTLILLSVAFFSSVTLCLAQAGEVDSSFGIKGFVKTSTKNTSYTSSAVQKNGKIVVVASDLEYPDATFRIDRYNADGTLDNTFKADRSVIYVARAVAIQSDGKILVAGGSSDFILVRYNTDGSIDKSFAKNGVQITDFNLSSRYSNDEARSVAIQRDGKIVVAGGASRENDTQELTSDYDIAIARYKIDGGLDSTFGIDGKQTLGIIEYIKANDFANSVVIQSDRKIVVAGSTAVDEQSDFFLARLDSNGILDAQFGTKGLVYNTCCPLQFEAKAVALQDDQKIVMAGTVTDIDSNFLVARFNTDGSPDNSFNKTGIGQPNCICSTAGFVASDLGAVAGVNSIAIQPDGKIIAGGFSSDNYALARYNPDGSLDSTFSGDGKQITVTNQGRAQITSIAISGSTLYAVGGGDFGLVGRYLIDQNNNNTPLTVSLRIPNNITKYAGPATFKLEATAKDSDGTISKVEFYNGTTLLHTETVIPYGYWYKNVPVGNYTLTAKAYDNSGNVTTSKAVKISVVNYNVAPVVRIVTPANNATIGDHATFRFGVFAKDPNDKISTVKFYNGTTLIHTETLAPYGYFWKDVKPGTYTITAVATDDKGLSATSAPVKFTVVPNVRPTVNIINPANNKTFTGPANIKFDAVAKDADGTINKVEFYNGSTLLHTETVAPYGYLWKGVPVGNYAITAKAYDNWGVVTTSAVINVSVIPNIAPTVSIINPANEQNFIAPATIPLVASATDADGKINKVEFYNGKTLLTTERLLPYSYDWTNVAAGNYTITAVATDDKGFKTTSTPITVTVTAQGALIVNSRPANSKTTATVPVSIKLYPNPASNVININTTGLITGKQSTISIISALGTVIKTIQVNAAPKVVQLDVSALRSGVYTVKVISGSGKAVGKFVKL